MLKQILHNVICNFRDLSFLQVTEEYKILQLASLNLLKYFVSNVPEKKMTPVNVSFSVQFTQLCPTLCDLMDCNTRGFPVHHQLPEPAQTHVYQVGDAIQQSHPLLFPSPPTFNLFPASGSFLMSQFFTSGEQSIGTSA